MKLNKCPHCGASVTVSGENRLIKCDYCNSTFEVEGYKEQKGNVEENTNPQVINNYFDSSAAGNSNKRVPKRPKFSLVGGVLLFIISPFCAFIYFIVVKSKQKAWDNKYTY